MQADTQNTSANNDPDSATQGTHAEPVINKRPNDPNWLGVGSESDGGESQQATPQTSNKN